MPFFLSASLPGTCFLPDLSIYFFQIRPVLFPFWRSKKATKLVFSFFWFILCCSTFCYVCMFAFVVFVSVFFNAIEREIGCEECLRNDLFCVACDVKL